MRDQLKAGLEQREAQGLYRRRPITQSAQGVHPVINGRELLSFCSNDYLGLANHPEVVAAFHRGLDEYGAGSGAAHLVTGHTRAHHELEEELAANAWLSGPADTAIVFETPYDQRWEAAAALIGIDVRLISGETGHA